VTSIATLSGRYAPVSNSNWKILPPNSPFVAQSAGSLDFGTFLVRMFYDMDPAQPLRTSSHGRQVYHDSPRDWSRTIWDIVEITAQMKLKPMGKEWGLQRLGARGGRAQQALLLSLDLVKTAGHMGNMFVIPDGTFTVVDPDDIARVAAEALDKLNFKGHSHVYAISECPQGASGSDLRRRAARSPC
jgi:hypothetical protein